MKKKINKKKYFFLIIMKLMLGLQLLLKKNKGYILTCDGKGGFIKFNMYFDKRKLRCVARILHLIHWDTFMEM